MIHSGKLVISFGFLFLIGSCGHERKQQPVQIDDSKLKKRIEEVQQPALVKENDEINYYAKSHKLSIQTTGSGLRYAILKENPKGKQIVSGDIVKIDYKVLLLDGTLCYSSETKGPRVFRVDHDNIETGVHLGMKLLRDGEDAVFILPQHLAQGLMGDGDKIPPKAAVVYEIKVLSVKEK